MAQRGSRLLRSLYGKLAAVLLALFCSIGILYILLTLFATHMYQQEVNQKLNRTLARNLVTDQLLTSQGDVYPFALQELFHLLMVVNPSIELYLLDSNGTITAFSAPLEKVKRSKIALGPIKKFLTEVDAYPILGDDPRDLKREKVFSVSPIPLHGVPTGYLYIVLGGEEYDSAVEMLQGSYILRLSLWAAAAGLLFALLAGLVFFNVLTRRVRQLASTMETFAKSDFSEQVPLTMNDGTPDRNRDEIDRLRTTFNQMVRRIQQQVATLKQADALRRELVANVSHDLRTPLASLHGYLETLLIKESTLSVEEQRAFLDIAIKQSDRLRLLVGELFELAKLNSHEMQINREPFSLAELVQDVAQKFQLAADTKQIALQTRFLADLPFVTADIGLIERALENLIQNALRHTPAGGTIAVALSHEEKTIAVQITDTGCGIPERDLPHIFDRFYRGDRQQQSDGAGLGLAITKRILELHGSAIDARSTLNVGTAITFQLPISTPSAGLNHTDRRGSSSF